MRSCSYHICTVVFIIHCDYSKQVAALDWTEHVPVGHVTWFTCVLCMLIQAISICMIHV